jgi:hypothetical protein
MLMIKTFKLACIRAWNLFAAIPLFINWVISLCLTFLTFLTLTLNLSNAFLHKFINNQISIFGGLFLVLAICLIYIIKRIQFVSKGSAEILLHTYHLYPLVLRDLVLIIMNFVCVDKSLKTSWSSDWLWDRFGFGLIELNWV